MSLTLETTGLGIAALLLAAADLGATHANAEISFGAVTGDPEPLQTGWAGQPTARTVFTLLLERPCVTDTDRDLADLLGSWWEAGYAARFDPATGT